MTGDLKRRLIILALVLLAAVLFLGPTAAPKLFPENWLSKPISLGLDLEGGTYLVYEIADNQAVSNRMQGIANVLRSDLRKSESGSLPVLRAAVNANSEIELTLLREESADKVREAVLKLYPNLEFLGTKPAEGTRAIVSFGLKDGQRDKIEREAVTQAVETLRNRVDQFGVAEPLIQKIGTKRILLQMPGVSDSAGVKRIVGSVAQLEFRLIPDGSTDKYTKEVTNRDGSKINVEDLVLMSGDAIDSASMSIMDGKVEVQLTMTSDGAKLFQRITRENVGRKLAIILDDVVYSAPNINEEISGGRASISGGFTVEEARELAVVLRSGAMPARLDVMEERFVGPTLGQESITKGINAIVVGFLAIVLFMVVYYKKSGLVAVFSLLVNVLLLLAALSAFGATLTLPGLAGLALTVGMAVDANVIIYERIRDELRNGAGRDAAVVGGFEKALSGILDSNITTLLAGLILYNFGTGPIRGFAVTLSIGILTTIFCAVFVSRLMFDVLPLKGSRTALSI